MLIDTLALGLEQVRYDNPNIEIESPRVNMLTGEISPYIDIGGVRVRKAYANLDNVHFTSKAKRISSGSTIQVQHVQFSAPKILGLDGVYVSHLSRDDIADALGVVRDALADNGIYTDTFDARVWRLDIACDVATSYPFDGYGVIFDAMHYRNFSDVNLGSTYRVGGKGSQWCVYDKRAECSARGLDVTNLPEHLMRFEYRLLKRYTIRDAGYSDVTSLLDGYDTLPEMVSNAWDKVLFDKGDIGYVWCDTWLETLVNASEGGSTRWLDKAIKQLGFIMLKGEGVEPDNFQRALLAHGLSHVTAKKYADALRCANLSSEGGSLLAELRDGVHSQLIQ
jgi:hypothetical protein